MSRLEKAEGRHVIRRLHGRIEGGAVNDSTELAGFHSGSAGKWGHISPDYAPSSAGLQHLLLAWFKLRGLKIIDCESCLLVFEEYNTL